MSVDYLNPIWGIIGTVISLFALLISYRAYTYTKPKLKVTVKKCEHSYEKYAEKNSDKINISLQLLISNSGDRGTCLNEIEAHFIHDGKPYKLTKGFERNVYDNNNEDVLGVTTQATLKPHDTNIEYVYLAGLVEGIQQEKIDCKFRIYHAHGVYSFKATSKKI